MRNILALVLAGGKGTRLEPLTRDRAKPAVPFGGQYRILDFVLSNCLNSGIRKIHVLTQYKAASLDRHINSGWRFLCREMGEYVDVIPPQQRIGDKWYQGTADAIYQNIYSIEQESPEYVIVLSGDHIYRMDYRPMLEEHIARGADLTLGAIPVAASESRHFGVVEADARNRVIGFQEKPARPRTIPGDPDRILASMGIYIFSTSVLFEFLCQDAIRQSSSRDFGKDVIPTMIREANVSAYHFIDRETGEAAYWRDVGTIDSYFQANMDLLMSHSPIDLYDPSWPFRTSPSQAAPPKFISTGGKNEGRFPRGQAIDSMIGTGSVIRGAQVERSVLSRNVRIDGYSTIEDSIIFENVRVGEHCRLRNAIIDKDNVLPPGTQIGYDLALDRRRGFEVTDRGIVVVPKGESAEAFLGDSPRRQVI